MQSAVRTLALNLVIALTIGHAGTADAQERDALPAVVRLQDVIAYARDHRQEIVAARAAARAAAHRPDSVSSLEDPVISASIDHLPFMLHGVDWSASVEQRFPLSRILGNRRDAAEAEARRARSEAERVALDVELEAAAAFLMLDERRQSAGILDEQLALARQFVDAANARYGAGTGTQADALRAETEVSRLESGVRSIAAEVRGAEAMFNTSLGRAPDAPLPEMDATVPVAEPPSAMAAREAALAHRPELGAGRAEVGQAEAEIAVMRSMDAPMAMARTGPAYTMADGAGWMLMIGISIPLWRSRAQASIAEAQAMAEMARADLGAMRRMVEGNAIVAREQVVASRERLLALREQVVPRAHQAIEPTLAGYASGQLPLVSVVEAAQTLWSAQAELVTAQFELGLAWARLRRAMGEARTSP